MPVREADLSAQVAEKPDFYAPREYGNNEGCAGATFQVGGINGDGIPDIACSGGQFLFGKGDGTFYLSPNYFDLGGNAFVLTDLNGDGRLDIIGANENPATWGFCVAFGNGDGTFTPRTVYPIADKEGAIPSSVISMETVSWMPSALPRKALG